MFATLPTNEIEFCNRFESTSTVMDLSASELNHIAFKNNGGIFNGGVCWWHSRFQRNALYLTILAPLMPKPNLDQARKIIKALRASNQVVTIPGFESFNEFTLHYQSEIQKELNSWQLYDGVVLGGWIDGLKGDTSTEAEELRLSMIKLDEYINVQKKIAYQKLQIKGITSHAWLIVNSKTTASGVDLQYIDSNRPLSTNLYQYKYGDISFYTKSYGNFVPYLEFTREENKISNIAKVFCHKAPRAIFSSDNYWEDIKDFENNL